MGRYDIREIAEDRFELYEDGLYLCQFSRFTLRECLVSVGRSSNWVGSILRIFLKKFPAPYPINSCTPLERVISIFGEFGLADYLRAKGYRVVKPIDVSDNLIIDYLESKGYVVSGLLNDAYYETSSSKICKI